ncbi:MSEP-CTERM sorting domain-containing protein [Pseudobacteroides cellulosolvens]|uniref:Vault protein inter-alpha-trypsin domain-containing protein n=1 Tax=Pseudobacteroides cellulosolvens ATCC 35603 = DSM 2933 TaxID=398512 RepID=A0A0L6JN32_9FIRM|nr:MSEP-CTERM sorting domain-containing protein [Pseudobacteroides cellulosolvens]KNY27201.1 Vault protein inter-alpha-trypsin domain-containing protein [Pseudobacteroides cellulosolvens ATCC 35603 = DSM 2933]
MKNILKPYWLLVSVSLPQLLIFVIMGWIFNIINSQLSEESIKLWTLFGALLGVFYISYTVYGIIRLLSKKDLHLKTGIIMFLTYIPYLYLYTMFSNKIIPSSIPDWMLFGISPNMLIVALVMPSMVVAMLICVFWLTPFKFGMLFNKKNLPILVVPAFWFVFFTALVPLLHAPFRSDYDHFTAMAFVIGTVVFLFIIVKLIYNLLSKRPEIWKKVVIPLVTLGPLFGLTLNNEFNIFGDFSNGYFYILAIFTGVLLVLPSSSNKYIRALLYIMKSITFTFSAYFFMIFLPYLPFSLLGLLLCGLGILLLIPVAQAFVHVRSLWDDFKFLAQHFNKTILLIVFICGASLIPALITVTFNNDKGQIDRALKFIYQQNLSVENEIKIDTKALTRSLDFLRENKASTNRSGNVFSNYRTPLISAYYNWYVLENLTLSEDKIKAIERIFLGKKHQNNSEGMMLQNDTGRVQTVFVDKHNVETVFAAKDKFYRSWVHLELKNSNSSEAFNAQFRSTFDLPEDCFITNYYLYVNNNKKYGMIADKRAANWIYDQIVTIRRDPGILSYIDNNTIEFKVFPFNINESRSTGFEVIHKKPIELNIEGQKIKLGSTSNEGGSVSDEGSGSAIDIIDGATIVPYEAKKELIKATRSPFYHFVIDRSLDSKGKGQELVECVQNYIKKNNLDYKNISISALNYNLKKLSADGDWQSGYNKLQAEGGLYLDNALKSIYFENYSSKSHNYPAVIFVSNNISQYSLTGNYDALKYLLPDVKSFYSLTPDGKLFSHALDKKAVTLDMPAGAIVPDEVIPWPGIDDIKAYLSADNSTSIVLNKSDYEINMDKASSYSLGTGFMLKAAAASMFLHPEKTADKTLEIVKASIKSGFMSPLTSYIVLENKAQEKVLLEKQKQILSTKKSLDVGEPTQMSEPSLVVIAIIAAAFVLVVRYRRRVKGMV